MTTGLIQVTGNGQSDYIMTQAKDITTKYISDPDTIIVAIVPVPTSGDIAATEIIQVGSFGFQK